MAANREQGPSAVAHHWNTTRMIGAGVTLSIVSFVLFSLGTLLWWTDVWLGAALLVIGAGPVAALIVGRRVVLLAGTASFLLLLGVAVAAAIAYGAQFSVILLDSFDLMTIVRVGAAGPANVVAAAVLAFACFLGRLRRARGGQLRDGEAGSGSWSSS